MEMRKRFIMSGLGMAAAYAVVATTAFAVFSPQAHMGLGFRTSSFSLKVSTDPSANPPSSSFSQTASLRGAANMYPGMDPVKEQFWLMNDSSTAQTLSLKSTFLSGDKDWDKLKYALVLQIRDLDTLADSGAFTPGELQTNPWPFPTPVLMPGEKRRFEIAWSMSTEYAGDPDGSGPLQAGSQVGNEAMGLETSGAVYVIEAQPQEEI